MNNKNKKAVKFQGDILNFCEFIQVFVFTRNHHLNTSYKLDSTLKSFNAEKWLSERNSVVAAFIKNCAGLDTDDSENNKKNSCVLLALSIVCIRQDV